MSDVQLTADERRRFGALVAQVWTNEELAARYNVEPLAVLAEYDISVDQALEIPAAPVEEINDEALAFSGAASNSPAFSTCGSASSVSCPGCTSGTVGSGNCCLVSPSPSPE